MAIKEKTLNKDKVGVGKMLLWTGNGASAAVQVVLAGYLSIYCTNALGLSAALVGTLLMVSKILDAFTDLIAGFVVDKTNTRLGRGRPYDLCIIGLWFTTWLLFSVPESLSLTVKCVWIVICYALCQSVFKTFMTAAGTPYMVRAFNNEQKYIKLSSWGGLLTTLVVVVFNVMFPMYYAKVINDSSGWSKLILFIAVPMCIIGILRFFFIPEKYVVENVNSEKTTIKDIILLLKTNKSIYPVAFLQLVVGISGNLSVTGYYYLYIVKNVEISGVMSIFSVIAMLTLILYPMLLKKITTKQLIQYSLLISILSGLIGFLALDNLVMLAIAGIALGVTTLPVSYLSGLLTIDCADYNEWNGRPRMEGTLSSVVGFANKVGTALGTFLTGILLSMSGFDGTQAVQPDSAIIMIRACNSLLPMVFLLLAAFILKYYKLDKMKPQINADLEESRKKLTENQTVNVD